MTSRLVTAMEWARSPLAALPTILAGHGYDVGGSSRRESDGDDGVAGIGVPWILAVTALTLLTIALLVWLNPSSRTSRKLKAIAPEALVVVVIAAAPLVAWSAFASGGDTPNLMVQRVSAGLNGAPELLVSLGEDDLNRLETTRGRKVVGVVCIGRDGQVVLDVTQKWPFLQESGYDYPHIHQPASRDDLLRADRCRLRGTRLRLEADVEGALAR